MAEIVYRGPPGEFSARINAALRDPKDLLDLIGQRVKETSVKAFRVSALGEKTWPPQYPGTPADQFVNVAGALADLNRGGNPKARRFQRKPPLRDTSRLMQSIAFEHVGRDKVRIGTNVPYAAAHQFGLSTSQEVKPEAKDKLRKWLKSKTGKVYGGRLAFLLHEDVLWTQVAERPFLGITPECEGKIGNDVQRYFKKQIEEMRASRG